MNIIRGLAFSCGLLTSKLTVKERRVGDVVILDMSGNIVNGEGRATLHNAIRQLIKEGETKILLNLARVGFADTGGINELVYGFAVVTRGGGRLKLLNVGRNIQNRIATTKILTVLDIYQDELQALNEYE